MGFALNQARYGEATSYERPQLRWCRRTARTAPGTRDRGARTTNDREWRRPRDGRPGPPGSGRRSPLRDPMRTGWRGAPNSTRSSSTGRPDARSPSAGRRPRLPDWATPAQHPGRGAGPSAAHGRERVAAGGLPGGGRCRRCCRPAEVTGWDWRLDPVPRWASTPTRFWRRLGFGRRRSRNCARTVSRPAARQD